VDPTRHIQVDPTNLIWLTDSPAAASDRLYLPPTPAGQPVTAGVVGEVVASWHPEFNIGDRVYAYWSWADYVLVDVELMKIYRNPTLRVPDGVAAKDWIALALTVCRTNWAHLRVYLLITRQLQ
jgi:NADPH-dependent curcumin reductase CurA